jgi:uncharacterized protein involved in exopolysaccharide biosynthesis
MLNTETRENIYKETDLREIILILEKRKKLIFSVTLAAAALAFLISSTMPKTYLVNTSLQIGTIVGEASVNQNVAERAIESVDQIKDKKNKDIYGVLVRQKLGIDQEKYPEIAIEVGKGTAIVSFSTESSDVEFTKKVFRELNETIIASHQKIFDSAKARIEKEIEIGNDNKKRLDAKIESLTAERAVLLDEVAMLQRRLIENFNVGNELVKMNAKQELEAINQGIEESYLKINESQRETVALHSYADIMQPTKVVKEPHASESPVAPKIGLNTILGMVIGFLVGIFIVFSAEWWNKLREIK